MKKIWSDEELIAQWTLLPGELEIVLKKRGAPRLGFAILLKFFQCEGRFPNSPLEVPYVVRRFVADQLDLSADDWLAYPWDGRAIKYHRSEIRQTLGFREASRTDGEELVVWLREELLPRTAHQERIYAAVYERLRYLKIEPPTRERLDRLVRSAQSEFERSFCESTLGRLSNKAQVLLDELVEVGKGQSQAPINDLKRSPGRASLESLLNSVERLKQVRRLDLPSNLFPDVTPEVIRAYRRRVTVEEPHELRRHPPPLRRALLASYCYLRVRELTDDLVDMLLEIVHRIGAKAERRVEKELLEDLKRVGGKTNLLFQLAEASLGNPDGAVKDVVFPVVNEQTLRELVKEWKSSGATYREHVQTVVRSSYRSHYRRMLPKLLQALEFRSNNEHHRPVMEALALLKKYATSRLHFYPIGTDVPVKNVVDEQWVEAVTETDDRGRERINRITYELCVLQVLRERLRCKEIWVVGADRYRDPDEDLPEDFEQKRTSYYEALELPLNASEFIEQTKAELCRELNLLEHDIPTNEDVEIRAEKKRPIKLSPLEAQEEPSNLIGLKTEIGARWPMTNLLDILKETDLRTKFTDAFRSPTAFERLDSQTLQRRLLLCLFGLGTNTGLKRVSSGRTSDSYKELLYVKRRFITREHLRAAITEVVNQTLRVRLPELWGETTTACASDSKKFGAWDQNLMTEWHIRYGGRGIMIYWHVGRKSACIYSQLRTCSSSEVAAMIQGVLRHCTDMEVRKQYVDSHGQSIVAFAFCNLLGFELLPRLKAIHSKRLYLPEPGVANDYPNLKAALARKAINWELISQQYDEMVKFATALRLGTAEAEAILRRFTRTDVQHPTYKALGELGRARRTIFLCKYLRLKLVRHEVQEALNVVENWNGANSFILFGKGGEFASNQREEQEKTMLALHLLQSSLVYINTLMIQNVLTQETWKGRLTEEDLRGLTPLFYNHINPYGTFELDFTHRMDLGESA